MFKVFTIKTEAIGLSLFRILYSLVLFGELMRLYKFRSIIYDHIPFSYPGEIEVSLLFYFWFVILLLLFFGLFTRFASIVNYLFSVIIFSSASKFEYHVYYVYVGINFLIMFMPVARVFSLDNLLQKLKFSTLYKTYEVDNKILQINYLIPVFVGIGLVYIDSVFHKLSSRLWIDGLGVWLPSSLPMITWNNTSILLNEEWLVKFLGYLVLIFEAVFVFLFWFKKWRIPLLILGVFFHIGILITYPIPYFALTYIVLYLLLIPVSVWKNLREKIQFIKKSHIFYYDAECPLCQKIIIIIDHFDVFHRTKCKNIQDNYFNDNALQKLNQEDLLINVHVINKKGKVTIGYWAYIELLKALLYTYPLAVLGSLPGISFLGQKLYNYFAGNRITTRCTSENCVLPIYSEPVSENQDFLLKDWNRLKITRLFWKGILVVFIAGQLLMIWFSPAVQNNIPWKNRLNKLVDIPYKESRWFLTKYLGITHHTVFLDSHFEGFNHIFKVTYAANHKEKIIPIIDDNGMPAEYTSGGIWRDISFNVITQNIEKDKMEKGILPYLKYYINENKIVNGEFEFYVKEIEIPNKWEKDFLEKQIAKPWYKVGRCKIVNDSVSFSWNSRMSEIFQNEGHGK